MYDCNLTLTHRNAGSDYHQFVEEDFAPASASKAAKGSVPVVARPADSKPGNLSGTEDISFEYQILLLKLMARKSDAFLNSKSIRIRSVLWN